MSQSPNDSIEVELRVIPRASQRKIEWTDADSLKVWVVEAPVDGQANDAIVALLSKTFNRPKRDVAIIRGDASRDKRIRISGINIEEAHRRLS